MTAEKSIASVSTGQLHDVPAAAPAAPSPVQAWLGVTSVATGAFAFVTTEFLPIGLLPQIAHDMSVSPGTAGLMVTVPGLIAAIAAPILMIAAGRMDRRTVLLILTALLVASNAAAALASNFMIMLAGRALFGAALGGFWTLAITIGARLVREQRAARATAIILTGVSFATIIGVPLGTFIGSFASWRVAFTATGVLAALALLAQAVLLPRLPSPKALKIGDFKSLFLRTDGRVGLAMVALIFGGHFAAYTYVAPFLLQRAGLDFSAVSTVLLGYGLAGFIGNFTTAAFVTRHLRAALLAVVAVLAAALILLPFVEASQFGVIALVLAWGAAFGGIPLCLSIWMTKLTSDAPEAGSAMFISNIQIAIALGSLIGGRVVDLLGIPVALWLGGGLALGGLLVFVARGHENALPMGDGDDTVGDFV